VSNSPQKKIFALPLVFIYLFIYLFINDNQIHTQRERKREREYERDDDDDDAPICASLLSGGIVVPVQQRAFDDDGY